MRNIYATRQKFKIVFVVISLLLVCVFLYISDKLVQDLSEEERNKMEIWAEATRLAASDVNTDLGLILKILRSNSSIPVIIVDEKENILHSANITNQDTEYLSKKFQTFKEKGNLIEIPIDKDVKQYLYYDDSILLKYLALFPYVQLGVMILFILIAYIALMNSKRAEQNQVWVGLSKETAHQLGTPISSLMAWLEVLQMNEIDKNLLADMTKDVKRLSVIAERFSKIGSTPELTPESLAEVVRSSGEYMRRRVSNRVDFKIDINVQEAKVNLCVPLMEWVVENLCKNAIDAMEGEGKLSLSLLQDEDMCYIDVIDTGKGIARKNFKTVFRPGYTTKKRGWGLGLALVKRIVEEYHGGRVYVKESEVGKGTTFRVELRCITQKV
ncbi:MAG: HAMP domain-containing histidine kinase [Bacteroidales bacterium]|nr:HAMP domain-containing histidine kinase [Bacteroidales bacterium]MBQ7819403.1 HAMP domain-containing histidine kinase [Bacteroidales bacterium]